MPHLRAAQKARAGVERGEGEGNDPAQQELDELIVQLWEQNQVQAAQLAILQERIAQLRKRA